MRVLSVNVGLPREVQAGGKTVLTSFFKDPAAGRVAIVGDNLVGDRQSDLTVHGGPFKAVYAYPSEHYEFWRHELPGVDLPWGSFGENLTTAGLLEDDVHVGDRLRIGSAELVVTQPRLPCFKLGIRFGRADMVRRFQRSGRTGFYFSVAREGEVGPGDTLTVLERHPAAVSIPEIFAMYSDGVGDQARVRQVVALPALSDKWRAELRQLLDQEGDAR
jgi:MOSC domain-containing protein YiiM